MGLVAGLVISLFVLNVVLAAGDARAEIMSPVQHVAAASSMRIAGPPPLTLRLSVPVSEPQYDVYLPVMLREQ
jgi:hypothetical protein